MKTVEKTLLTIEALNILGWAEQENGFIANVKLPVKLMWNLQDDLKALIEIREKFNEFNKKIEEKYGDDEHSFDAEEIDNNGQTQKMRRVRDEYLEEFNKERNEIFAQENNIKVKVFDIEDFGDIEVSVQDMGMLGFFIADAEDTVEAEVVED